MKDEYCLNKAHIKAMKMKRNSFNQKIKHIQLAIRRLFQLTKNEILQYIFDYRDVYGYNMCGLCTDRFN